jgi:parallel beta-helix repeat protein
MTDLTDTLVRPRFSARAAWVSRLWRDLRFLDVVLLVSVPLVLLALLIGESALRYVAYAQFDDFWGARGNLNRFVTDQVDALRALPARVALRHRLSAEAPDPGIIRLEVDEASWQAMQSDPLAMWGQWVDATLQDGDVLLDVSIRKRGDNSIHWLTDKRTLTVRTKRNDFYKQYRQFGLSTKDVLPSYVANRLAREFDLLAPATAISPVFLNNQFFGVFRFIETADEGFLRTLDRMPGNIFRGDTAERGDYFKGVPRAVFENFAIWDRVSMNDRPTAAPPNHLRLLIHDLNGGTFEDHLRLMNRLNRDELARLLAYLLFVGDPYHMDGVHNQFIYEDPSSATLHPIPWDSRLRELARGATPINELLRAIVRDPWVVDGTMREVQRSLGERRIEQTAERIAMDAETRYHIALEYDRLRGSLIPPVGTLDDTLGILRANGRTLRQWLTEADTAFTAGGDASLQVLDFETRGRVGADLVALDAVAASDRVELHRDGNRNGRLDPTDPPVAVRVEGSTLRLEQPVALLPTWKAGASFEPAPMAFRLFLTGAGGAPPRPRLVNRATGAAVTVVELAKAPLASSSGWHPWGYPQPQFKVWNYSGDVRLTETLRIPSGDTLVVAPGTTLRLGPDVSLISRGRVQMEGTPDRPIRILPLEAGRPWGTFTVLGDGGNRSVVRHAEFIEGGGGLVDRIEYIGMVNVHGARQVIFDSVLFLRNRRCDDTFHVLNGDVALVNSRFVEANSDAVDYDISIGEIRGNIFEGSGGDAIDLMTSTPLVIGNRIRNAGDKGISIGEASSPVVFDNLVEDSVIGVEIKDGSAPVLLNNEFRRNGIGLRSRLKNWRYGGSGFGLVANTRFEQNDEPLVLDAAARLTLAGVAGLETTAAEAAVPLDWLYRRVGIDAGPPRVGLPAARREVPRVPALAELRFVENFESRADGWVAGPRVTELQKHDDVLRAAAAGGPGAITSEVDWDLPAGGGVLVLEMAGQSVQRVNVSVFGRRQTATATTTVAAHPSRYTLIEIPLESDRYHRVSLELDPTPGLSEIQRDTGLSVARAGRLFVRSVAVYPLRATTADQAGTR